MVCLVMISFLTGQKARDVLPACFCDDHLCPNVMKSFPEVRTLQLYLDLFHGWRWRRLRAWATRGKVRMGPKWAGCPFCQHLCVRSSALFWVCKGKKSDKTLQFYLLWGVRGGKRRKVNTGGAKELYNGILNGIYLYGFLWSRAWFGALSFQHSIWLLL